jgi:glycosyltransferase involved in cell wall biosynthesis
MKICVVSDMRLPSKKYGGTERLVEWLINEFRRMGHFVTLIAPAGSALPGVFCIPANSHNQALQSIPRDADIVHFHSWPPPSDFDVPWLYTLHGDAPGMTMPRNTVYISSNHTKRHGGKLFIYNGVNPDELVFKEQKQDYLLFLSLIRRKDKGAPRAIRLARRYDLKMVFAGGRRWDLLKAGGGLLSSFHPNLKFVGKVAGQEKAQYLANARALLFPIDWEEPFGLVLIESLMSGTPVLATPRGSVPELIPNDVGALFTGDESFPEALERAISCSPKRCRDWAMTHFTSRICAENYVRLYERLVSGEDVFGSA